MRSKSSSSSGRCGETSTICSSRSLASARRLRKPVSGSVVASPRLVPSSVMCSPSVSHSRTPATSSVANARLAPRLLTRSKWSTNRSTSAASIATSGSTSSRRPSSCVGRTVTTGCHAAIAVTSADAGHSEAAQGGAS